MKGKGLGAEDLPRAYQAAKEGDSLLYEEICHRHRISWSDRRSGYLSIIGRPSPYDSQPACGVCASEQGEHGSTPWSPSNFLCAGCYDWFCHQHAKACSHCNRRFCAECSEPHCRTIFGDDNDGNLNGQGYYDRRAEADDASAGLPTLPGPEPSPKKPNSRAQGGLQAPSQ